MLYLSGMTDTEIQYPLSWIEDYFDRLYYILAGGVADFFEMCVAYPLAAVARTSRSMPNNIYDFAAQRAREAFLDIPDQVDVITEYETVTIRFLDPGVAMKLHKADNDGLIHPPSTARAYSFYYQTSFSFGDANDDVDGLTLNGCYQLDANATALSGVFVSCQDGDSLIWRREVPPSSLEGGFGFGKIQPQDPPGVGPDVSSIEIV